MAEQNVDRLSALPDGVICHILSFMPTKLSVKTSILAKRWRFLWAHVPILDLQGGRNGSLRRRTNFAGIIRWLMLHHEVGSLTTFRLNYDDYAPAGCRVLKTCIATAIERNVQNLDLHLAIELPGCVLTCKTLVDLSLCGGVSIPYDDSIYLPALKKLYYHPPVDDVHFPRLVSGCPVIEELIIDKAPCYELEYWTISSPTLKRFTFSISMDAPEDDFRLKINAPALGYLKVNGVWDWRLSVSPMNLIEADILLSPDYGNVLNLLGSICNVKCLKLSGHYYDICDGPTMSGSIVKFVRLTKLQLTSASWCFITKFLESAGHLQELIIHEVGWGRMHSEDWMEPIEERCACLLHSLRTVRIDPFRCTEKGFNMVKFILKNAQVLERIEICTVIDFKKKWEKLFS